MTRELRTTVGGDVVRHTEAGDPVTDEGSCAGLGGGVRQRDGFGPPGEAVYDGEKELHALRLIKGVDVEAAEATVRGWSLSERCMDVSVDLRRLAGVAISAFHSVPHEA